MQEDSAAKFGRAVTNVAAEVAAVTVHYNTPDLLERMLASVRERYSDVEITVIDGSDHPSSRKEVKRQTRRFGARLKSLGYNIHHGPGLDLGIRRARLPRVLLLDTDLVLVDLHPIERLLQHLPRNGYGAGQVSTVDRDGVWAPDAPIHYLHPRFMLVNRDVYLRYPAAIKHGAPMIQPMIFLHEAGLEHLLHYPPGVELWYVHDEQSTVGRTGGYHLDITLRDRIRWHRNSLQGR
jgi:hypothetical protein